MLSRVYKAKLLEGLKELYSNNAIVFPNELKKLTSPYEFQTFIDLLYKKEWVVYSKPVFKSASHVINYLGRYTHKVAIYADRITYFDEETVTFSYHDRSDNNKKKKMTLAKDEFIRRFLDHVLPHRFTKIRHYGFLTNRFRHIKTDLIRRLISKQRGVVLPVIKALDKLLSGTPGMAGATITSDGGFPATTVNAPAVSFSLGNETLPALIPEANLEPGSN